MKAVLDTVQAVLAIDVLLIAGTSIQSLTALTPTLMDVALIFTAGTCYVAAASLVGLLGYQVRKAVGK
jgi:hypothetical protein